MDRSASKGFESFFVYVLRLVGCCVVMALGFEAALTRNAACCTVFAMALGVALALVLRSALERG